MGSSTADRAATVRERVKAEYGEIAPLLTPAALSDALDHKASETPLILSESQPPLPNPALRA